MAYEPKRCEVLPLADHQVALSIDGVERTRWHFGDSYPRPFFYPFVGPSGTSLTRMGHPGAENHDHHRSVWFAHAKVLGIDFWSDRTDAFIRQKHWLAYEDGNDEAVMAVLLTWHDRHEPTPLLEQELIAVVRPTDVVGETLLELHCTFRPLADSLELQKSNFGFLAVRVAQSISAHFGGGDLTSSEGTRGEPAIFGKAARWMDYSGPVTSSKPRTTQVEGITYFDHPSNVSYPSHWHVREDGWMGASLCRNGPVVIEKIAPLQLRYLLHAHAGDVSADRANRLAENFASGRGYSVTRSTKKHRQYEIVRAAAS